jgi:hypothetical protein
LIAVYRRKAVIRKWLEQFKLTPELRKRLLVGEYV